MDPLVVQKYGGTSVGSAERLLQVAEIIKSTLVGCRTIVVVSAMSSYKKSDGTTSRLLTAAIEVLKPESNAYLDIVDKIELDHINAVENAISNGEIKEKCIEDIKLECKKLRSFMAAAEIIDEISPRSRDIIISSGEKLSARILTAILCSQGVNAKLVVFDKIIKEKFDERNIDQAFYDHVSNQMKISLQEIGCIPNTTNINGYSGLYELSKRDYSANVVPVVTGFFGPVPGSILKTVGRGYTDLTAALIAVGMKAQELQIWKEVDGIFTADPRKVKNAHLISSISPDEAAELTYYGSEVIHPFTMEQAIRASIPIRIKNAFNPLGSGTVVLPKGFREEDHKIYGPVDLPDTPKSVSFSSFSTQVPSIKGGSPKHPTAVTIKNQVTVLNVHSNKKSVSHGFFAQIFQTLDRHGIVVDLIATSEVHVSMALSPVVSDEILEDSVYELRKYGAVSVIKEMAILSLVGRQMRHLVGVASKLFTVLAKNNVNIEIISQGASEINISCVIAESASDVALNAVHDECIVKYLD